MNALLDLAARQLRADLAAAPARARERFSDAGRAPLVREPLARSGGRRREVGTKLARRKVKQSVHVRLLPV